MARNERGEYVNEKGVTIKPHEDKRGKNHEDFYDKDPTGPHSAIHITVDEDYGGFRASYHNEDKSETDDFERRCYLTTACMQHYSNNFDDNCYELTLLRWFRDNFVSKEDVQQYYKIAPKIVQKLAKIHHNQIIYNYIYNYVIDVCVKAIEKCDYDLAYNRYKETILGLEKVLIKK